MRILVFDTETTGLPKERNPSIYQTQQWPFVIQLSYVVYDSNLNEVVVLVNDYINIAFDTQISKESQEVHKITREMLNEGITIKEALHKFNEYSKHCDLIVGHNVSFDKRMVIVEGIRNKIKMNVGETYCTMRNSTEICKIEKKNSNGDIYLKFPSLSELHFYLFKKNPKNTHNALIDILICLRCYCKIELNKDITRINRDVRTWIREAY
jgi:DNA polymerase III epsilon subunit-like protein